MLGVDPEAPDLKVLEGKAHELWGHRFVSYNWSLRATSASPAGAKGKAVQIEGSAKTLASPMPEPQISMDDQTNRRTFRCYAGSFRPISSCVNLAAGKK